MRFENVIETIGNTPLIRLNNVALGIKGEVFAKVEYFNPGNSVKDRMALKMVQDAEKAGELLPGATIIECTSGNTGMGLAIVAAIKGYKCIFTMNDKQSQLKIDALRALGAEVIVCPTNVEPDDPRSFYSVAVQKHKDIPNSYFPNQYHNPSNLQAHYETTGPEIWNQTEGKITHFVAGAGTGGTISGSAKYLKEQNPEVKVIGIDPFGSILKKYKETGIFDKNEIYPFLVEGIGEDILPDNLKFDVIDEFVQVTDKDGAIMARNLSRREGLFVGWSSGTAVHGALQYARKHLKDEDMMVIILPDHGSRYLNKIYNENWMDDHGFMENNNFVTALEIVRKRPVNRQKLISVDKKQKIKDVVDIFKNKFISQIPVTFENEVVGSLSDNVLLRNMFADADLPNKTIEEVMERPFVFVSIHETIDVLASLLNEGHQALLTRDENDNIHIITQADIINALGKQ